MSSRFTLVLFDTLTNLNPQVIRLRCSTSQISHFRHKYLLPNPLDLYIVITLLHSELCENRDLSPCCLPAARSNHPHPQHSESYFFFRVSHPYITKDKFTGQRIFRHGTTWQMWNSNEIASCFSVLLICPQPPPPHPVSFHTMTRTNSVISAFQDTANATKYSGATMKNARQRKKSAKKRITAICSEWDITKLSPE
jgi:hypothetical protein